MSTGAYAKRDTAEPVITVFRTLNGFFNANMNQNIGLRLIFKSGAVAFFQRFAGGQPVIRYAIMTNRCVARPQVIGAAVQRITGVFGILQVRSCLRRGATATIRTLHGPGCARRENLRSPLGRAYGCYAAPPKRNGDGWWSQCDHGAFVRYEQLWQCRPHTSV